MSNVTLGWSEVWSNLESFNSLLGKSKAIHLNSEKLRENARVLVQLYFRAVRPELESLEIECDSLDAQMQRLLQLAQGRNLKTSYQKVIRSLRKIRKELEPKREMFLGARNSATTQHLSSGVEAAIAETLDKLVPSAALSYRQALIDLQDIGRFSYRGPASDLRECLRETLNMLAPNEDILASAGFKLEKGRTSPTMKQKVRFILKSRGLGKTARSTPEASIGRIEEGSGVLARSLYSRGSASAHISSAREEVCQLKLYLDGLLGELLQIHKT